MLRSRHRGAIRRRGGDVSFSQRRVDSSPGEARALVRRVYRWPLDGGGRGMLY